MPIILSDPSKFIIKSKETSVEQPESKKSLSQRVIDRSLPNALIPKTGTKLYVNGKERTIGKKSQYLLDMLTIDDK